MAWTINHRGSSYGLIYKVFPNKWQPHDAFWGISTQFCTTKTECGGQWDSRSWARRPKNLMHTCELQELSWIGAYLSWVTWPYGVELIEYLSMCTSLKPLALLLHTTSLVGYLTIQQCSLGTQAHQSQRLNSNFLTCGASMWTSSISLTKPILTVPLLLLWVS